MLGTVRNFNAPACSTVFGVAYVVADLNQGGIPDVAVLKGAGMGCDVSIWLGNPDRTFSVSPNFYAVSKYPIGIAFKDFNGDGKLDLFGFKVDGYLIYLGNGDGTFNPTPIVGDNFNLRAIGDLNNDGKADALTQDSSGNLIIANLGLPGVDVFLQDGSNNFELNSYSIGAFPSHCR